MARAGTNISLACPGVSASSYVYLIEWVCEGCVCVWTVEEGVWRFYADSTDGEATTDEIEEALDLWDAVESEDKTLLIVYDGEAADREAGMDGWNGLGYEAVVCGATGDEVC